MLNWKLILIFIVVFWMFAYGVMTLSYLSDIELSELFRRSSNVEKELIKKNYSATTLSDLAIILSFGYVLGYLIAFISSLLISRKQKLYWLNSVLSLVVFWIIGQFNLTGWDYLKNIFLAPGEITEGTWYYLTNGLIMVGLGIALLFVANKIVTNTKRLTNLKPVIV